MQAGPDKKGDDMKEENRLSDTNTTTQSGSVEFKAEDYLQHIEEFDLSEEQQNELLQTLWNIMSTFVDIGWGVDTVQLYLPDLFNEPSNEKLAPDSGKLLESKSSVEHQNNSQKEQG